MSPADTATITARSSAWSEHHTDNVGVAGSNPAEPTSILQGLLVQLVEFRTPNPKVVSSNFTAPTKLLFGPVAPIG